MHIQKPKDLGQLTTSEHYEATTLAHIIRPKHESNSNRAKQTSVLSSSSDSSERGNFVSVCGWDLSPIFLPWLEPLSFVCESVCGISTENQCGKT